MTQPIWTEEHAATLRALRAAAGVDLFKLAQRNSLSVKQLRQLEEGGDSAFYTPHIKWMVGRKLILALGGTVIEPAPAPAPSAEATSPVAQGLDRAPALLNQSHTRPVPPAGHDPFPESLTPRPQGRGWGRRAWALGATAMVLVPGLSWVILSSMPVSPPAAAVASPSPLSAEPETQGLPPSNDPIPVTSTENEDAAPPQEASLPLAHTAEDCRWVHSAPDLTPVANLRPSNYVYVEAQQSTTVCWRDAQNKTRKAHLEANGTMSFWGTPPFQVYASNPSILKVYFKGQVVRWPLDAQTLNIVLGTELIASD